MSIAWSTIAFLVLLLPGFLFLVGIYFPENFTRETAPKSALGQLAATVLIAFLVHGSAFAIGQSLHVSWLPDIDLEQVFHLLQVEPLPHNEFQAIARSIERYRWWILGYTLATSLIGLFLGREMGCLIVSGRFRGLAEHAWVYDLQVEGVRDDPPGVLVFCLSCAARLRDLATSKLSAVQARLASILPAKARAMFGKLLPRFRRERLQTVTVAYTLTDTVHQDRYLLYRGSLKAFGISKDGRPRYLVLSNVFRTYMLLGQSESETSPKWHRIGSSDNRHLKLPGARLSSYLVLSGDRVLNVVFDRHAFTQTRAGMRALGDALANE